MTPPTRASVLAVVAMSLALAGGAELRAQSTAPSVPALAAPPVDALFADASAKESAVRTALAAPAVQLTVLKAVRAVVSDYETLVRHYPASGRADDALWRAARLSRDAFEQLGDARERTAALRLLQWLASEYPASTLAKQAPGQRAWLDAHPAASTPAPAAAASAPPASLPAGQIGRAHV